MDSGNSGSMQSSSCGEEIEEYDSRAESSNFSPFLNNPPPTSLRPPQTTTETTPQTIERNNHVINQFGNNTTTNLNPQSQQQHHHHHHNQMFDPLPNYYIDSLQKQSTTSSNPNSFLNLDMIWSKATARSEPNNTDLSSLLVPSSSSSSSSQQNQQAFLLSQFVGQRENVVSVPTTHQQHHQYQHQQQQLQHHSLPLESTSRGGSLTNEHQDLLNTNNNNVGRNPKKRSRASRRAPTTVLTTDTTNFRAMVQEFTGIPAPPFSSPFPRTRLDLFGSSVSSRSMSNQMDPPAPPPPPYLLRPFAQKIQPFSQLIQSSSSSMMENLASTNSASINYHLSQQNNLPLMQHNQILGFQSISQTPTKYPHGTQQPSLETTPNVDSRIKIGTVFDELGLSHANVNNNNNVNIGVLHHHHHNNSNNNNNNNMVTTTTTTSSDGANNNNENQNQWSQRTNDFGSEKVHECTTTRGEGTVESWINCSSSD